MIFRELYFFKICSEKDLRKLKQCGALKEGPTRKGIQNVKVGHLKYSNLWESARK